VADSRRGSFLGRSDDADYRRKGVFEMSMEFALGIALLLTCLIGFGICALAKWHKNRFVALPPPQRQVFRDAFKEHVHAVGNMRGIK
jgi:hypothetical protein